MPGVWRESPAGPRQTPFRATSASPRPRLEVGFPRESRGHHGRAGPMTPVKGSGVWHRWPGGWPGGVSRPPTCPLPPSFLLSFPSRVCSGSTGPPDGEALLRKGRQPMVEDEDGARGQGDSAAPLTQPSPMVGFLEEAVSLKPPSTRLRFDIYCVTGTPWHHRHGDQVRDQLPEKLRGLCQHGQLSSACGDKERG